MNDAQVWTALGILAAALTAMITLVSTLFLRTLDAKLDRLEARIDARFGRVESRLDAMDRDINALFRHTFGIDRGDPGV